MTPSKAPDTGSPGATLQVRVLATSDLHAHLLPFDYFTDSEDPDVGLARLAGLIARARDASANTVLVDNGDTLQGTPLADAAVDEIVPMGRVHPMIAAMNALRYDAGTLGNHDFDFGLPHLEQVLASAAFPIVCANAEYLDGRPFVPRSTLLERVCVDEDGRNHTLKIGITGSVPPQLVAWNRPSVEGKLTVADARARVADSVHALREAGADMVLVLAHSGMGSLMAGPGAENVALQLAELDGVDAVVAGHTHRVLPDTPPQPVIGTPIVQPGAFGSHLGCIDLRMQATTSGGWSVVAAECGTLRQTPSGPESRRHLRDLMRSYPALHSGLSRDHRATRSYVDRPLGASAVQIETYFSTLAPCKATQLVAEAQLAAVAPAIAGVAALQDLPLLSAVAPFKAGGRAGPGSYTDIPAGPIKLRHAADLYIYPNMLSLVRMTGKGILDWLERSASIYNQIDVTATAPQALINPEFAPYNFDRLVGLRYEIDVSAPARTNAEGDQVFATPGRIKHLRLADGTPFRPTDEALIVTNSYRAAGGGHAPAVAAAQQVRIATVTVRDAVARYISLAAEPIDPKVEPTWSLRPLGGTSLTYCTGPGALACKARLAELELVPCAGALPPGGFQPFAFTL